MKTLPTKFTKNGFNFEQIERAGDVAIFRQTRPESKITRFEVIKVQKHKAREAFGNFYEAAECYPSSELWGQAGWTYLDFTDAVKRFEELQECSSLSCMPDSRRFYRKKVLG